MNKVKISCMVIFGVILFALGVSAYNNQEPEVSEPPIKSTQARPKSVQKVASTDTTSHGWGFVRNKLHQRPEITRQQENILKKYPVIYTLPSAKKEIALTFDLGYENGFTPKILDTLKAHKVPATFFVTGYWLKKNPELSKRMLAEGHILGNHTMDHPSLAEVSQTRFTKELQGVEQLISQNTGKAPGGKFLRPPMGEYSERSLQWAKNLGYTTVFWSVALKDWQPLPGPQVVVRSVMSNVHPGAVVLLHGISRESTEGLDELLNELTTEGYKVVPIKEVRL
ncbi:MAG TPA: polysaccharide deacetylase family protein [Bacillota bacterium]|nr:polysaccharide deacetylase family protein [Bacillota bacterium]